MVVVVMVRNTPSLTSGLLLSLDLRAGAVTGSRKEKVHSATRETNVVATNGIEHMGQVQHIVHR